MTAIPSRTRPLSAEQLTSRQLGAADQAIPGTGSSNAQAWLCRAQPSNLAQPSRFEAFFFREAFVPLLKLSLFFLGSAKGLKGNRIA